MFRSKSRKEEEEDKRKLFGRLVHRRDSGSAPLMEKKESGHHQKARGEAIDFVYYERIPEFFWENWGAGRLQVVKMPSEFGEYKDSRNFCCLDDTNWREGSGPGGHPDSRCAGIGSIIRAKLLQSFIIHLFFFFAVALVARAFFFFHPLHFHFKLLHPSHS